MKFFFKRLACLFFIYGFMGVLSVSAQDLFVMTNIPVSADAETALLARTQAITNGEKQAFTELLDKIVAPADRNRIPTVTDEMITSFVQDVSVAHEKAGSTRYMGALTVRFKAEPIRSFLAEQYVTFLSRLPQPALVLPLYREGIQTISIDDNNPLWQALRDDFPASRLFQFKIPVGDDDDKQLAVEAVIQNKADAYKQLAQKYNVTQIMIVDIYKQGTQFTVNTRFLPKNSAPEAEIQLNVSDDRESSVRIVRDLLSDTIRMMSKKWLYLSQNSSQPIQAYAVVVPIEKISDLSRIRQKLQQLNFAEKVDIKGFANKQLNVTFHYRGNVSELGEKLRLNDLILTAVPDETGQLIYLLSEPNVLKNMTEQPDNTVHY